jgi:hypothetical protein
VDATSTKAPAEAAQPAAPPAASNSSAPPAPTAPASASSAAATSSKGDASHGRVPSIKFVGKRDTTKHEMPPHAGSSHNLTTQSKPTPSAEKKGSGKAVEFTTLKGMGFFGRPAMTQREIDAVESGGATL